MEVSDHCQNGCNALLECTDILKIRDPRWFAVGFAKLSNKGTPSKKDSHGTDAQSGMPHMDHDSSFSHGKRKRLNAAWNPRYCGWTKSIRTT